MRTSIHGGFQYLGTLHTIAYHLDSLSLVAWILMGSDNAKLPSQPNACWIFSHRTAIPFANVDVASWFHIKKFIISVVSTSTCIRMEPQGGSSNRGLGGRNQHASMYRGHNTATMAINLANPLHGLVLHGKWGEGTSFPTICLPMYGGIVP